MMFVKQLAVGLLAAGTAIGMGSASFARNIHGTTNSTIKHVAPGGATGKAHSTANRALRTAPDGDVTGSVPGENRSLTGTTNSTIGSTGAKTGVPGANGKLHSGANKLR